MSQTITNVKGFDPQFLTIFRPWTLEFLGHTDDLGYFNRMVSVGM